MKFGINTFLFTSPFTTADVSLFPTFKAWGFDSVEIALEDASHIDAKTVKQALDDNGLICNTICAALGPGRDLRGSSADQEGTLKYLTEIMEIMPVLDCKILAGPLYSSVGRADFVPADEYKLQWELVVKNLRTLSGQAEQAGLKLAIEPLNRYETDFINTSAQAMQMLHDVNSSSLYVHLDTFHMNLEEKDPAQAIINVGDKLALLHASGSDRGTPGGDQINWDRIFAALKTTGYDGDIVIESFTPAVKIIAKAASIWRNIEPSIESIAQDGLKFLKTR
jgi:D-psicose/D-tagatose/L-ribulose 3-epimerase